MDTLQELGGPRVVMMNAPFSNAEYPTGIKAEAIQTDKRTGARRWDRAAISSLALAAAWS